MTCFRLPPIVQNWYFESFLRPDFRLVVTKFSSNEYSFQTIKSKLLACILIKFFIYIKYINRVKLYQYRLRVKIHTISQSTFDSMINQDLHVLWCEVRWVHKTMHSHCVDQLLYEKNERIFSRHFFTSNVFLLKIKKKRN